MIRFILLAIVILLIARAFWRLMDGIIEGAGGSPRRSRGRSPAAVKLVRDPVCGTFVQPRDSLSLTARGETHYFCSDRCRQQFQAAK